MFKRKQRSTEQKVYGLIGFPLTHSFSQTYFNRKFEAEKINARYVNFEIPDIGFFMEIFAENPSLSGLNVTIPYKQQVIPYLNELSDLASRVGAVNVIKITRGKNAGDLRLKGFNTDCHAFMNSIRPMLKPYHKQALVLGSGGASRAVCVALEELGVKPVVVSRSKREGVLTYDELTPEVMKQYNVVVNTTPLGMYPKVDDAPPIPYDCINDTYLCYDLLYNPEETLFMKRAAAHGATTKNGLEMLLLQAFESWEIWNS